MLAKVANIEFWVLDDLSCIELFVIHDASEQGGFAGPVSADESDFGIAHDGAFRIFHQNLVAVVFGSVSNLQQDGHSHRGKARERVKLRSIGFQPVIANTTGRKRRKPVPQLKPHVICYQQPRQIPGRTICGMSEISQSVTELIDQLGKLPGIGRKTAERLAYHLLRVHESEAFALSDAIRRVRENVRYCSVCYNLAEGELCGICMDSRRDTSLLCIVEQPRDLIALEQSGVFRGLYHVLLGRIAPLEGIGPDQLTIDALVERVRNGNFSEAIMATNPNVEGDGTALFISNQLDEFPIELTRLARGVTSGSVLEFTNKEILADALSGRQKL